MAACEFFYVLLLLLFAFFSPFFPISFLLLFGRIRCRVEEIERGKREKLAFFDYKDK